MELAGAHVVVTGGSQGIGLETARLLVAKGARVSLVARDATRLTAAATDIAGGTQWRSADVTDPDALGGAFATLVDASGPVDLLITSAGV